MPIIRGNHVVQILLYAALTVSGALLTGCPANNDVTISFVGTPRTGCAELTVNFSGSAELAKWRGEGESTNKVIDWLWTFGDGTYGVGQTPTHVYKQPGVYTVSIVALVSNGSWVWPETLVKPDYIKVNNCIENVPPVADAGDDQNLNLQVGATTIDVALDGSGSSDSDGTIETYTWSGTPNPDDVVGPVVSLGSGTYTFSLEVTDNDGATSNEDTVTINVNAPPVAEAGPEQNVNLALGAATVDVTLDGSASTDSDGTITTYAWIANNASDPDPADVVSPTVSLTAGPHTFSLVVTDDDGATSLADSVTINVNIPPVASADAGDDQNVSVPLGATSVNVSLDGSRSTDSDGTVVFYAWTPVDSSDPDPADVVSPIVTLTPGSHTFNLVVTDDKGAISFEDTVTVYVNIPPVADAGADRNVNLAIGATTINVTLDGGGSTDADGTVAAYAWTAAAPTDPDPTDEVSPVVALTAGPHTFNLIVTDDDGAVSASDSVTINVNIPPVANAGADQNVNLAIGAATINVTLDGSGSTDADGTVTAYAWTAAAPTDPDPTDVVSPVVALTAGSHTFNLVVTDDDGAVSASDSVTINVNIPPVANAGADQNVNLAIGATTINVTLDGSGSTDSDGTVAIYAWTATTPTDPDPTDVVSPVVALTAGPHTFNLVVTDDDGAVSASDSVTINVNIPPVANAGPDQNVNLAIGEATINVTLDGGASTDSDGTVAIYAWTATTPTDPTPMEDISPVVTLTAGPHTFNLVVTDDDGALSASDSVTINVNIPPVANAGADQNVNLAIGATTINVTLNGSGSTDADGTIATYSWTAATPTDPDPTDDVSPVVALTAGPHTFNLIVTDDDGAVSASDSVTINVNIPPVANAGADQNVNLAIGATTINVTLNGGGSTDADGTVAAYAWTAATPTDPDPTDDVSPVVALTAGPHTFNLIVTDDDGAVSASDSVTINVNIPPVANAGADQNVNLAIGATTIDVTLDGSGSTDADGTVAAYAWTAATPTDPDPTDDVSPVVTLTAGPHTFNLVVTDDDGAVSASDSVTINVNIPPVANAGADQNVNLAIGAATIDVTLDGSGSTDADGTVVTYTWTGTPTPSSSVNPTLTLNAGTYTFELAVTDDDGAVSAKDAVTIYVNTPPVAVPTAQPNPVHSDSSNAPTVTPDPDILYAMNENFMGYLDNSVCTLDYLDPATGDTLKSLPVIMPGSGNLHAYCGIGLACYLKTGEMWGLVKFLDSSSNSSLHLVKLDPRTGVAEDIGIPNPDITFRDLTCDSDGNLYSMATDEDFVAHVYLLNGTDASETEVFSINQRFISTIAFDSLNGLFYHAMLFGNAETYDSGFESSNILDTVTNIPSTGVLSWPQYPRAVAHEPVNDQFFVATNNGDGNTALLRLDIDSNGAVTATTIKTYDIGPNAITFGCKIKPAIPQVQLDGSQSYDPDPLDAITSYAWTVVSVPTGSAITDVSNNAIVNPTFTPDEMGEYVFSLTVSDGKALSAPVNVTVTYENTPPVSDAGEDQTRDSYSLVELNGSESHDNDYDLLSFSWRFVSIPSGSALTNADLWPSTDFAAPNFTPDRSGNYVLELTVNDGKESDSDIVVISINLPPVADAGDDQNTSLALGESTINVTLDGSGSTDSDGTIATYTWTADSASDPDPADSVNPTVALASGAHTFTLIVTDDDGAVSAADSVTINVNIPPVADAGDDQRVTLALGSSTINVTLDGSGSSDAEGPIASYAWTANSPSDPDPSDVVGPTVTLASGSHTFTLIVTDGDGALSASDSVTIFVNNPPVADAGDDQNVNLESGDATVDVTLDGSGSSDTEGPVASYAWTAADASDPDPSDIVNPTVSLTSGPHTFTLVVTDADGALSETDSVTIDVNIPPIADAGPDQSVNLPLPYFKAEVKLDASKALSKAAIEKAAGVSSMNVTLDGGNSNDADGQVVSYRWTGSQVDPDDIEGPIVLLTAGTHTFTLVVTDDDGAESEADSVVIYVNTPPVAVPTATPNPVHSDSTAAPTISPDPDTLYALEESSSTPCYLLLLDPATGNEVSRTPIVLPGASNIESYSLDSGGLACDLATGEMWALLYLQNTITTNSEVHLVKLDSNTGVAEDIGAVITSEFNDLTVDANGVIYTTIIVEGGEMIFSLDSTDASETQIFSAGGYSDSTIAFDSLDNRFYQALIGNEYTRKFRVVDLADSTPSLVDISPASGNEYSWSWELGGITHEPVNDQFFAFSDVDGWDQLARMEIDGNGDATSTIINGHLASNLTGVSFGCKKNPVPQQVQLDGALPSNPSYDPDNDAITSYSWAVLSVPTGSAVTAVSNASISNPTFTPDVIGDYVFSLTVSDGKTLSAPTNIVVTFENSAPVADAGDDQFVSTSGLEAQLDGSASYDVDYDRLNFSWTFTSTPSGSSVNDASLWPNNTSAAPKFMPDYYGTYELTLTVTEATATAATSTDTVTVTIGAVTKIEPQPESEDVSKQSTSIKK